VTFLGGRGFSREETKKETLKKLQVDRLDTFSKFARNNDDNDSRSFPVWLFNSTTTTTTD